MHWRAEQTASNLTHLNFRKLNDLELKLNRVKREELSIRIGALKLRPSAHRVVAQVGAWPFRARDSNPPNL